MLIGGNMWKPKGFQSFHKVRNSKKCSIMIFVIGVTLWHRLWHYYRQHLLERSEVTEVSLRGTIMSLWKDEIDISEISLPIRSVIGIFFNKTTRQIFAPLYSKMIKSLMSNKCYRSKSLILLGFMNIKTAKNRVFFRLLLWDVIIMLKWKNAVTKRVSVLPQSMKFENCSQTAITRHYQCRVKPNKCRVMSVKFS